MQSVAISFSRRRVSLQFFNKYKRERGRERKRGRDRDRDSGKEDDTQRQRHKKRKYRQSTYSSCSLLVLSLGQYKQQDDNAAEGFVGNWCSLWRVAYHSA